MKEIVLLVIFGLAVGVCWPQQPVLLTPGRWQAWKPRPLTLEDLDTETWITSLQDVRVPSHRPGPSAGKHRAEPHVAGKPLYGEPRPRTAPLPSYTELNALDSTAVRRLRDVLDEQHEAVETSLNLPDWARYPEG